MSSDAYKCAFLYLPAQPNFDTLFIDPTQNHKKSKKIPFEFFVNKSLKNHSAKNICRRAFCLAPNERIFEFTFPINFIGSPNHLVGIPNFCIRK